MIDTHTHIYMPEFDADRTDVVARAMAAGVNHLVLPNVDLTTIEPMQALHAQYPDYTSMAMGFHPTEVNDD
jgi:TatD DNase family protein